MIFRAWPVSIVPLVVASISKLEPALISTIALAVISTSPLEFATLVAAGAASQPQSPFASTVYTWLSVAVVDLRLKLQPGILNLSIEPLPKVISFDTLAALGSVA